MPGFKMSDRSRYGPAKDRFRSGNSKEEDRRRTSFGGHSGSAREDDIMPSVANYLCSISPNFLSIEEADLRNAIRHPANSSVLQTFINDSEVQALFLVVEQRTRKEKKSANLIYFFSQPFGFSWRFQARDTNMATTPRNLPARSFEEHR